MKKFVKIIFGLLMLLFIAFPAFVKAEGEFFGTDLKTYSEKLYAWSIGIAGSLAIIMLIYAGYLYVVSMGNTDQINSAKEIIIGALSGLALLILASLILRGLGVA